MKNELFMSNKMITICIQLKQNRGQNEIMKIMKILRRIYVLKKKKQRLSAKIMTRPIVQSAPNAIDCNV